MKNKEAVEAYAAIQQSLSDALNYWLYGSLSSKSLKIAFSSRFHLRSQPLVESVSACRDADMLSPGSKLHQLSSNQITVKRYAELLAELYQIWEKNIPQTGFSGGTMPKGQDYESWLNRRGADTCYWPVHSLRKLLCNDYKNLFSRAIVHGSIATLDDTQGFSDMDLAFVICMPALKDPWKLLALRKLAARVLTLTFAFDPFMHHGPYYISEMDLAWYPEAMFPPLLFSYGVDLLDDSHALEVKTRSSEGHTDQMLDMFDAFFQEWSASPFILKNSYDLEWVLGSVMLLPALYLQRLTGIFRYKRDTFLLAEQDFPPEEWEPVRIATELRKNMSPRPKPSRLLFLAALNLRYPGLLQSHACSHPVSLHRAREVTKVLGAEYPQRVLLLLNSMRNKLHDKANCPA